MKKGTLYIVSAPSGAGKSSLIASILKRFNLDDSLRLSVSHTTRQPRPGEVDHVSYHFVTNEEFEALIARGAFYEYAHVFDHYYGTSKEIVEQWLNEGKDVLLDIDWQGARQIREQTPDAKGIFIVPPSLEELNRRLVTRATDAPEVIEKRMNKAMGEISHYDEYDYVIVNDDFEESVLNMRSIILANRSKLDKKKEEISELFDLNKN
ncbi:MAG: guanylate kinase [Succinivibrio dextrinosolvens]|jgi:guanylate kinase|uniref:Guanylate kinase n=2 Tax=Succinivibrio TaxID=83770 RepID=A0A662Z8B2_9GAMM|nr:MULTISPECIES: guanylate kinase [Succinivibrio]MBQ3883938.1 guanylate kinase [Succinivibrio sp.]MBQ9221753.1 guanylate kinase [Succinivibrio sp.]MDY6416999.1 guanylate kinase [Succinivibrio dextrinosolvens]MDY6420655.1 guanylate kinase [Succinivibrio dextrinosolvens]MDY6466028.1 guanylate kinase [Succinivibrio dextrinosolvens]